MTNFLHHPGGDADNLPESWINPPVFVSSPLITEQHLYSLRHFNSLTSIVSSSASSTSVNVHLSCDTSKITTEEPQTPPQVIQNLLYNIIEDYEKTEEPSSQTCLENNDESHLSREELDSDVTLSNCETIAGDYLNSTDSSSSSLSTNLDEDKGELETKYRHTSTSCSEKVNVLQENEDDYKNIYLKYYDSASNASSSFSLEELLPLDYDQKETIPIHSSQLNFNRSLPMMIKISYSDMCLNEKISSTVYSDRENSADFAPHVEKSVSSFSETSSITTSCKDDSCQELEPSTSEDQTRCTNYDDLGVNNFESHNDSLDVLSSFISYQPIEDVSFEAQDFQDASISKYGTQIIINENVNEDNVNVDKITNKEYNDTQHINEGLLDINQTNELFACNVNSSENLVVNDQTPMEPYLSELPQLNDLSSSLNCRKEEGIFPNLSPSCNESILMIDKSTTREICPSSPQFYDQLALKDTPKLNEPFLDQVSSILPMHQQTFNNVSSVNLNIDKELPLKDASKDYPQPNHEYNIKTCSMLLPLDTLLPTCNLGKDEDDVKFVRVLQSEEQSFNFSEPFSTCLEKSNIGLPIYISKNKEKINYPEHYQDYPSNDDEITEDNSPLAEFTQQYFDPIRDDLMPHMNVLIPEHIKEFHVPSYPDKELLLTSTKINEKNHLDKICRSELNSNIMELNKYIKRPNGDANKERVIKTGLEKKAFHQISFLRSMLDISFQLLKELFFSAAFPSNPYY